MEKPNLYESLRILHESGFVVEKKLRSEMTPEELAVDRAKSKARREARKIAAAEKRGYEKAMRDHMTADYKSAPEKVIEKPYYFRIFQKMGNLGNGWWREGKPEPPEYRAYPSEKDAKEALRGLDWNVLERGGSLKWDPGDETGFGWRIEMTEPRCINPDVLKLLDADLAKGYKESIHSRYDLD